ncbi:uncharacterized protein LOC126600387 [Malus sylvestris]|uniref:uncharacterized protein LOC126600387 n=1 Tax=Malus sylvestris TaxID=3752 RepID=UPI0010AA1F4B|nr:uncharacterized protein LOC114821141 [Malus domestica]XP_050122928.1 uncharacterized protein LOC126600387 [Malus sylvestris]
MTSNPRPTINIRRVMVALIAGILISIVAVYTDNTAHDRRNTFNVTRAFLTGFKLTSTTNGFHALHYSVAFTVAVQNPDRHFRHENIQVVAYYKRQKFATAKLTSFLQVPKNITLGTLSFEGQVSGFIASVEEDAGGAYEIDVELSLRNSYFFMSPMEFVYPNTASRVTCDLKEKLCRATKKKLCPFANRESNVPH